MVRRVLVSVLGCTALLLQGSCLRSLDRCTAARAGESISCPMPGWVDRSFELELPPGWDGKTPLPIIVAFHGGGGNRRAAATVTCPTGEEDDTGCLSAVARARGVAVVRPDGTGARPLRNVRTWNAGGGTGGLNCTSGGACRAGIDDERYFDELLAEVERIIPVDPRRIHLTGLSNGGAISHRLACARPDRVASIVAVGGTNQHARAGGACDARVPVLQIHGTSDPCWTYETSESTCVGSESGVKVGVPESMEGWRTRNGCTADVDEELLPDRDPNDGVRVTRVRWRGCAADVELLRMEGAGHTWPSGHPYLSTRRIGRVGRDIGSEVIVEFFLAHPR